MREFLVHSVFFGAAVSLVGYEVGLLLKRKFKMAIFNPLFDRHFVCYGDSDSRGYFL